MSIYQEVLKHLDGVVERSDYASALCPYHDDSKQSLMVYKDGFYCLACGMRGTLRKLLKEVGGRVAEIAPQQQTRSILSLPKELDELEELCDNAHEMLESYREPLAWYLKQRKVDGRISAQNLGYYNRWYSIPVYDRDGGFMGAVFRASPDVQQATNMRYYIPTSQPSLLYVPNWRRTLQASYVVVVFGILDALSLEELEIPACTPTHGMLSLKPEMLSDFRVPILVLPDKGEEETGARLVSKLGWRGKQPLLEYPEGCKDMNDVLMSGNRQWIYDIIKKEIK